MGGIISGAIDIGTSIAEGNEASLRNKEQYDREKRQADVAIQGALERGDYEATRQRILTSSLIAKQKQAYTASGVDATSGTAAAVQADTAALGTLDAQQIAINAARDAWGFKEQRKQAKENYDTRESDLRRKQTAGILGGFAKGISSGVSFGS